MKLTDLQGVVDNCGKNYPTLRKLKVLFSQMYEYAMKYEICMKDYSEYVDITKVQGQEPEQDRPFSFQQVRNRCSVAAGKQSLCTDCPSADIQWSACV